MSHRMSHALTITQARAGLTKTVAEFRSRGADAEPVVFGGRHKPEAVVLPYETYTALMDLAEEVVVAEQLRSRREADTGERFTLAEVAEEFGVDLGAL